MPRLVEAAFNRLVSLVDGLVGLPKDNLPTAIDAQQLVIALVAGPVGTELDAGRFASAVDRLAAIDALPPLLGSVLGRGVQAGSRRQADVATAVSGGFRGMETRLSSCRLRDNEMQLHLHALAYNLATFLRCIDRPRSWPTRRQTACNLN
jgi:hypothetical protein